MPQGESFFNPYRWVHVSDRPVARSTPAYHHRFEGLSGRIHCRLTALTPLMVSSGTASGQVHRFIMHPRTGEQFIPATSLKGAIRSLAEVVANAASTYGSQVDRDHDPTEAMSVTRNNLELDIVARTFGYLGSGGRVYAGSIQFTDAKVVEVPSPPNSWPRYEVAVGAPRPTHRSFYPDRRGRKFYHHRAGATSLVQRQQNITQFRTVQPAPPESAFEFHVFFSNLSEQELSLLLYCLALENNATVRLSAEATHLDPPAEVELRGPLRHKIGGCKPHGAGSVHIEPLRMRLQESFANRYRPDGAPERLLEADALVDEIARRTGHYVTDTSRTMQELRAMLIYHQDDPRAAEVRYPTYNWFHTEGNSARRLKPTL